MSLPVDDNNFFLPIMIELKIWVPVVLKVWYIIKNLPSVPPTNSSKLLLEVNFSKNNKLWITNHTLVCLTLEASRGHPRSHSSWFCNLESKCTMTSFIPRNSIISYTYCMIKDDWRVKIPDIKNPRQIIAVWTHFIKNSYLFTLFFYENEVKAQFSTSPSESVQKKFLALSSYLYTHN